MRGDHHGGYPWYAMVHHTHNSVASATYHAHAWTLGVYTREMFYQYAGAERLDRTLPGALVTAEAYVSRSTLVTSRSQTRFTLPFQRFATTQIPRDGVWVLVVYDVDQPNNEPELVYHEYSVSESEVTAIRSNGAALLPLSLTTAHHVHHLKMVDINVPRLMMRLSPWGTSDRFLELSSALVEIEMGTYAHSQYTASELGETTLSAMINEPTDSDREFVKKAVDAVAKKHLVSGLAGYYTTSDGQFQLGAPGAENRIASQAMAVVAIDIAIRETVAANYDKVVGALDKFNPKWRDAGDTDNTALFRARGGVEALFAAVAPGGRDSLVLAQLQRIFGDKGIPTLTEMLGSVGSGLPHSAPLSGDLADHLRRSMAAKVDMDAQRDALITEQYMSDVLSRVQEPEWTAGKSPLTMAVLMSAMPDNFVTTINEVLRSTLDMPNATLKHAGVPPNSDADRFVATDRTEPGVYVVAPLDNYERAARRLLTKASGSLDATGVKNAAQVKKIMEAPSSATFEAADLQVCGLSPAGQVMFFQADALRSEDQSKKLAVDATKWHAVQCIKDTLGDGSSLAILLHRATQQTVVIKFAVEHDHRNPFLRDVIQALVGRVVISADQGKAVSARVLDLAERTLAIDAYSAKDSQPSSSDAPSPAGQHVPLMMQLLRSWKGAQFVPVCGSMDSGTLSIQDVTDDTVRMIVDAPRSVRSAWGVDSLVDSSADRIGLGDTAVRAAEITISPGNTPHKVRAVTLGSNMYVDRDSLAVMAAAQNVELTARKSGVDPAADAQDTHDPFGLMSGPRLVNPAHINSSGERQRMIQERSPLIPNNVGAPGQHGLVMSPQERCDPSVYNSGPAMATDDWYSPFA